MKRTLLIALPLLACLGSPAIAQLRGSVPGPIAKPTGGGGTNPPDRAPAALPGARAEPNVVTPATKSAADMPPTEALFDAVNRGDILTAKDAISRGADIDGRNVLGLTPLELSVDLGRNNITFLLLSLRGGTGYSTATGSAPSIADKPQTRAERLAAERAARAEKTAQARELRAGPAAPPGPQTARLFAGNGGAPVPQAGFLGFNPIR